MEYLGLAAYRIPKPKFRGCASCDCVASWEFTPKHCQTLSPYQSCIMIINIINLIPKSNLDAIPQTS
eukprot:5822847-Amphidinium_carterae.1